MSARLTQSHRSLLLGITDYDKSIFAAFEASIPNTTIHKLTADGGNFVDDGYPATDPDCWWSWKGCVTPKLAGLPPDISYCKEPETWGFTLDDGPNCSHNATNEEVFAELYFSKKIIKDIMGITVRCWRPPFGDTDDRVRYIASKLDLETVLWNLDTDDWNYAAEGIPQIKENYQDYIKMGTNGSFTKQGAIVLTHEIDNETMTLSEEYLPQIRAAYSGGVMPIAVCNNNTQPYVEQDNQYVYPNYAQWMAGTRTVSLAAPTAVFTDVTLKILAPSSTANSTSQATSKAKAVATKAASTTAASSTSGATSPTSTSQSAGAAPTGLGWVAPAAALAGVAGLML
ncbi:chitin deacetylase, carbohydrate esterase family 4 protein [Pseudohyphozyma bogoriensis]|nr:chitin deacetylase, carbohydrate esterase family 4 protein [Pseudohyphozyma bogoriensis]